MLLLDASSRIYMIGSELHGDDEECEPVATWDAEQMPPQCNVEWTRMPLETRAALYRNSAFTCFLNKILNFVIKISLK